MAIVFSTSTVASLTGASVRMVDHWARSGLIRPSGQDAAGRGSRRRYTFQDVVVLQAVQKLREANCPLGKIRAAIRYLKANYPALPASEALARLTLLTDGRRVYLLSDGRELMEVVTRQLHITWAVPLGRIILDTSQRLERMSQSWIESVIVKGMPFRILMARQGAGCPFVASCLELQGVIAEAVSADAAIAETREAIALVLAHAPAAGVRRLPRPRIGQN